MNAQQLRNSILQEAIEGRLVPQDPNDEPASVLLERIREEKKRLVKEGKLKKKDLEVKPISEDEIPFEIPKSWEWVRLGDIITYQNGYSYNSSETNKERKGVPVIKSGNIMTLDVVVKPNNDYVENPTNKMLASKIVKGDMLMCLSSQSDNPEPLGKTAIYKGDGYALLNQRVLKFRPITDELTSYLYYAINSFYFWYNVSHQGGGSAQANLKLYHVLDMLIPLPPIAEQYRIVSKIGNTLIKVKEYGKAQEALNKLNEELPDRLKKSILQEAISGRLVPQDPNDEPASVLLERIREEKKRLVKEGQLKKKDLEEIPISEDEKPFEIPESWEWVRIPDIGISQLGKTKNPHQLSGKNMPYLCSINVYWEGINLSQTKEMMFEESELDKYTIKKGDLLICEGGDCGRSAIWDKENTILYQNALHRVRFFCDIESKYILNCIYLYKTTSQLDDYIKGETIKHLVKGELDRILFPLPPLAEQKRIVAKIEEVFKEIDKLKK